MEAGQTKGRQLAEVDGERPLRGDAGGHGNPRTKDEARVALAYTQAFCRECPVRLRCREEACAIWRAEDAALAILGDDLPEAKAGVPLEWSII